MKAALIALTLAAPAMAQDWSDGVSGVEAAALVAAAMAAAGIDAPAPAAPVRGFPACDTAPAVAPRDGDWRTAEVTCAAPAWTRALRTAAAAPAAVARADTPAAAGPLRLTVTRSLPRGAVLTAADLALAPVDARGADDGFADPAEAIGRRLRVALGLGQPLLLRHLEPQLAVAAGSDVVIELASGPLRVAAGGIALDDGQTGDRVRVQNAAGGRIVTATVIADGRVAVAPNIP